MEYRHLQKEGRCAMNNEGNILAEQWKKRYEALPPDIQKRLDDLSRHFDRGESDYYKLH